MATTTQPRARSRQNSEPPAAPEPQAPSRSKLRGPLIVVGTAVAGIAGGIAIGAKARPRKRRSLLSPSREQIAEISKGFAAFTRELNKAGEKAEQLGKAID